MNIIVPPAIVERNTKLNKRQMESAYKHIQSLKNAARSIQASPRYTGVIE